MAKQDTGYLGGFRGNLGPAVGYKWRGKWCVRSKPAEVRNPRTDEQMRHRWMFREEVRLAADMLDVLHLGLRERSLAMGMTESNLFVQRNQECFGWEDEQLTVDYQHLVVSMGNVPPVAFDVPQIDEHLVMTVEYSRLPSHLWGSASDLVQLYIYCPSLSLGMLAAPGLRWHKRMAVALPSEWEGREVHVWGFVQDYLGCTSDSFYLGGGPLEPGATDMDEEADNETVAGDGALPAATAAEPVGAAADATAPQPSLCSGPPPQG